MSQLLSILNSGESLEKAIVLTHCALEGNPDFYTRHRKIVVIYYENLPKQDEHKAHGTIGGLLENLGAKARIGYATLNDLWEDREDTYKKKCNSSNYTLSSVVQTLEGYLNDFKRLLTNQN